LCLTKIFYELEAK
jgi:hypothetical protein